MKLAEAMRRLKTLGTEQTRKTYRRHGASDPLFGVRYADLYVLHKESGVDHALALALFETGNHDARILATLIADPEAFTTKQLDAWQKAAGDYVVNGAITTVAAKSSLAPRIAMRWRKVKAEYRSAAGWGIVASLSAPGTGADDEWLRPLLEEIRAGIATAPNRTRNAMNNALISIGGYREALRAEALAVAKAIGKVEVDHGDTGCKTPDAVPYIKKMAAHQSRKAVKKKAAKKKAAKKKR